MDIYESVYIYVMAMNIVTGLQQLRFDLII